MKWEYKVGYITTEDHYPIYFYDNSLVTALNKFGAEGWEAVEVHLYPGETGVVLLKRAVSEPSSA